MRPALFDFDGTVADSAPVITESFIQTLREEQNKDYPPEFFRRFIGPPLEDTFAQLGADDIDRYVTTYRSFYSKRMFNIVAEATHGTPESRKAFWKDLGNG